ncbi:PatB family C-S lyase [bacterium]|nr:PatB family C-S lyase [bacterium]
MTSGFDHPPDRRGTDSLKWRKYAQDDVLPLWVADMDFASPPAVVAALQERAAHGVFGYGEPVPDLVEAVTGAMDEAFGWRIEPDWIVWLPGLVSGLSVACRATGEPGLGIGVAAPVYPPFLRVPPLMDRKTVRMPLAGDNVQGWRLDTDLLEANWDPDVRLFLLCHPHNPVGRVWTESELEDFAALCLARDAVICSDEIHNQLVLEPGLRHRPLATLDPEIARRTITLLAPSKTFNIAGLGCSLAVIPEPTLRRRFDRARAGIVPDPNVLGMHAAAAAWSAGGGWLAELLDYLRGNRDLLAGRVAGLSGVTMAPVEATYLAWLDVRALGLDDPHATFLKHGLGFSDGADFGAPGHLRLNFGCSRSLLSEACDRLDRAVALIGS